MPKRITRSIAEKLSATPQYKKEIWELHKKKHENLCKEMKQPKKKTETRKEIVLPTDIVKTDQTDEIQELKQHSDLHQHSAQDSDLEQDPDLCISVKKNDED